MNILIITGTYTPSTNGVAICTAIQKEELEKRGHKVWIIAPKHPRAVKENGVIRLQSIIYPKEPDYPIILPIPDKEFIKGIPRKIDLVYFQHPYLISEMAFLAAKFYKCPTVFYYHTQHEEYAKQYLPKFLPHPFINWAVNKHLKNVLSKTNHVIVGSPTFSEILQKMKVATPHSIIPITRSTPIESGQVLSRQKIALCVTRVAKEKNLSTLLWSWAKINTTGWQLVIVGDGPDRPNLEKLAHKLKLANCLFTGRVNHENIWDYYQKASLFVFPSKTDVQPGVIFEAMFAGLPVVAFDAPGPADFTIHSQNSFLAKNNLEFGNYLKVLMHDRTLLEKMGQASLAISKKYTLNKSIDKLETLFEGFNIN